VLIDVSSLFPERDFGWLGGRTQNPLILRRYLHRATSLFPITIGYDNRNGKELLGFLLRHIAEVSEVSELDLRTGVCHKIYKTGRLGDYPVDLNDPEVAMIEKRLSELGMSRDSGDAVVAIAKLKEYIPKTH
jgi:hypothetical protein